MIKWKKSCRVGLTRGIIQVWLWRKLFIKENHSNPNWAPATCLERITANSTVVARSRSRSRTGLGVSPEICFTVHNSEHYFKPFANHKSSLWWHKGHPTSPWSDLRAVIRNESVKMSSRKCWQTVNSLPDHWRRKNPNAMLCVSLSGGTCTRDQNGVVCCQAWWTNVWAHLLVSWLL